MEHEDNVEMEGDDTAFIDDNEAGEELNIQKNDIDQSAYDMDDMNMGEDDQQGDDDQQMEEEEEEEDFEDESVQGFFEHTDSLYTVAINKAHPDIIVTGGGDDLAYLWDRGTGEKVFELRGHTDSVSSARFNFDGTLVATGGMDGIVRVWTVETGVLHVALEGPSEAIEWLEWHPKGNILVAGSADCCAYMWSTLKGDILATFIGHSGPVSCGAFTPDGKRVVTGSEDGTVKVWSPKDSVCQGTISGHNFHTDTITSIAVRGDNAMVITGGMDHFACLSNINTYKAITRLAGHTDSIETVAFSNVNSNSATDKRICVWDERNGELIKMFRGHQDTILEFDISPDGSTVVTAGDDKVSLVFSLVPPQ
eukprot:gene4273-4988_t